MWPAPEVNSTPEVPAVVQRPWWKKKRYVLPIAGVVGFGTIGALADSGDDNAAPSSTLAAVVVPSTTPPTSEATTPPTTNAPETTANTEPAPTTQPTTPPATAEPPATTPPTVPASVDQTILQLAVLTIAEPGPDPPPVHT